jgi:NADH-quinone oxidoreductase subunit L
MVAAGVFLIARFFPVFEAAPQVMNFIAIIGGLTTVIAASMAIVMNDIKRVIAYSTISQLGLMVLALGVGAREVAIFHLFNHAFFKALLFLVAGSVNHATGTFDMRDMGGLRKKMPWTYVAAVVGGLSLVGIFPLSGFWSKDELLLAASSGGDVAMIVYWMGVLGVALTAFYTIRMLLLTFHGEYKGKVVDAKTSETHHVNIADPSFVMLGPIMLLVILAVVSGFLANPVTAVLFIPAHWFVLFLGGHSLSFDFSIALLSSSIAIIGLIVGYVVYGTKFLPPSKVTLHPVYKFVANKYYLDYLYEKVLVERIFYRVIARSLEWVDGSVVDKVIGVIAWAGRNGGKPVAALQVGQLQAYGLSIALGVTFIFAIYIVRG